jgi:hypothetical protein
MQRHAKASVADIRAHKADHLAHVARLHVARFCLASHETMLRTVLLCYALREMLLPCITYHASAMHYGTHIHIMLCVAHNRTRLHVAHTCTVVRTCAECGGLAARIGRRTGHRHHFPRGHGAPRLCHCPGGKLSCLHVRMLGFCGETCHHPKLHISAHNPDAICYRAHQGSQDGKTLPHKIEGRSLATKDGPLHSRGSAPSNP